MAFGPTEEPREALMNKPFRGVMIALAVVAIPAFMLRLAHGSDHADTPELAANPGQDLSDVFIFPSPQNVNNVVLVMDVNPLIGPGKGLTTYFDPGVLYQFKI